MVSVNRRCVSNRDVVAMVANSIGQCRREVLVFQHETSFDLRMNDTFPFRHRRSSQSSQISTPPQRRVRPMHLP
nr:hypothetical protein Itr_chr15CG16100 [Ipomoea trifida]